MHLVCTLLKKVSTKIDSNSLKVVTVVTTPLQSETTPPRASGPPLSALSAGRLKAEELRRRVRKRIAQSHQSTQCFQEQTVPAVPGALSRWCFTWDGGFRLLVPCILACCSGVFKCAESACFWAHRAPAPAESFHSPIMPQLGFAETGSTTASGKILGVTWDFRGLTHK